MNVVRTNNLTKSKKHKVNGQSMSELPPALLLFFACIFFPFLNLLYICLAWGAGFYLNQIELRQVTFHTPPALGGGKNGAAYTPVTYTADNLPQSQAWGHLMGVTETESPIVTEYPNPINATSPNVYQSAVLTTVSVSPVFASFGNVPILSKVPGLGKSIQFTYYSIGKQEEYVAAPANPGG